MVVLEEAEKKPSFPILLSSSSLPPQKKFMKILLQQYFYAIALVFSYRRTSFASLTAKPVGPCR